LQPVVTTISPRFSATEALGHINNVSIVQSAAGTSSLTLLCEIFPDGRQTLRGTAVLVHLDHGIKTSKRIPDAYRERLQEYADG